MSGCGGEAKPKSACGGTSQSPAGSCGAGGSKDAGASACPLAHFENMIGNCYEYAVTAKSAGTPIVGILCEYTPREVILAAGAVPVCLCGGSADTIPAAETDLPANLCPLIKSTYGYHVQGSNPFLEMADLVVAETTCDGKKKMYELMARTRPMLVLELPQRSSDPDNLARWTREIGRLKETMEQRFGVEITDARLRDAIATMNRERSLRRRLAQTMQAARPPLTGRQLLDLKSSISGLCSDFAQYERAIELFSNTEGPPEAADRVRVLMTGVPMAHGAERPIEIVEAAGGLVVALESCSGLKPILEDVDPDAPDPLAAIAEKYYRLPCSVLTPNDGRLDLLRTLARDYRAQCIIDLTWQACLTYDVESARVRDLAHNELHLPYLQIQTDYSPSDTQRIRVRVEALLETVRA